MEEAGDRFEESLDVLTRAWTTDEPWSHQGKYWRFNNIIVEPPTIQKPHPPFWMGAGSPNSIEGVAERGYNLLLDQFAPINVTLERMQTFRTSVESRGRKFDANEVGVARGLYVARDAADRDEAIQRRISARNRIDNLAQRPDGANKASIMSYDDTTETALEASLFGTVEEIVEKVSKLSDGGVKYILLSDGGSGIEGLRQFSKEVMPVFSTDEKAEAAE